MTKDSLQVLVDGYRVFREEYVGKQYIAYREWADQAQTPKVMVIACSDSRVNPAIITHAGLGDLFMVNNVANLVPPYKEGKNTHHSTSSALEFAVNHLHVEHVIVLGHSGCGGIKALMQEIASAQTDAYNFIGPWVDIAQDAKTHVLKHHADLSANAQERCCEREALLVSLRNLQTFPWIKHAMDEGELRIHAWYFDIAKGDVSRYCPETKEFVLLLNDKEISRE